MRFLLFFLFFLSTIHASFVGSPASSGLVECGACFSDANRFSVRVGYETDFVFDGLMEKKDGGQMIDSFEQKNFLASLVFNFGNRFDFYGSLGQSQFDLDYRIFLDTGEAFVVDAKSHYRLSWSIGTSMILLDYQCMQIGWGIRYLEACPDLVSLSLNGEALSVNSSYLHYKSLDTSIGLAFQTGFLVPYVAFHYRNAKATLYSLESPIVDDGSNVLKMEEKNPYGLAIGVSITNKKQMALTIESRVLSEEALTISGTFRF